MLRAYIPCLILLLFFGSCRINTSSVKRDSQIDDANREEIKKLSHKIHEALVTKNAAIIKQMLSSAVSKNVEEIDILVNNLHVTKELKSISVASEFLVQNVPLTNAYNVHSSLGSYAFEYTFTPAGNETYIYLFYLPDSSEKNDYLIATVYNKENNEWKLQTIQTGYITNNKLIAPYIYEKAKELWYAGDIIPATYYALLSSKLALPSANNFHYAIEKEMSIYLKAIIDSANTLYKLPNTINSISSKPVILALCPELKNGNLYTMIAYNSSYQLSDSLAIKLENKKLHNIIGTIFPKINTIGNDYLYRIVANFNTKESIDIIQKANTQTIK